MIERPIIFSTPMVKAILAGKKTQTRRLVDPQPQKNGGKGLHPVVPYNTPQGRWTWVLKDHGMGDGTSGFLCPYGQPGDQLWVREKWGYLGQGCSSSDNFKTSTMHILYHANDERIVHRFDKAVVDGLAPEQDQSTFKGEKYDEHGMRSVEFADWLDAWWKKQRAKPSIHMPRLISRIDLLIKSVRIERLNDISESDALAEGVQPAVCGVAGEGAPKPTSHKQGFIYKWNELHKKCPWSENPWVWVLQFERVKP